MVLGVVSHFELGFIVKKGSNSSGDEYQMTSKTLFTVLLVTSLRLEHSMTPLFLFML